MDLDALEGLLAVVRTGSLSGAANRLGVSTSTIWRRLAALERELGLRLVDRRRDGATLTPHGLQIAGMVDAAADQMAKIMRAATALREDEPEPVRVSATEPVIAEILAPALAKLWARAPRLRVQLEVSIEVVSLARRDADIAIRMAQPVGDSLVARKLPSIRLGLYVSRAYLRGRAPDKLDLREERLLVYDDSFGRIPELRWLEAMGLGGREYLRTTSTRALVQATRAGAGVGLLPEIFAGSSAELIEIPTVLAIPPRGMWIVMHRDLRRSSPIRTVHAWIQEEITAVVRLKKATIAAHRRVPGALGPRE